MSEQPFEVDPLYIIAALLEVAGGEVSIPQKMLSGEGLRGNAIELEDLTAENGTFLFKLSQKEQV